MAIKRVLTTVPRSEQWEHREAREPSTTMERSGIVVDYIQVYEVIFCGLLTTKYQ